MIDHFENGAAREQLAANVRRLRVARHLSLSELARLTAISKATLSGIERRRANPTIDTLSALAAALRVSPAELLHSSPPGEVRIVRGPSEPPPPNRVRQQPLETVVLDGELELLAFSLPAGHVHHEQPRSSGARTQILVLQGTLVAGPVERISELVAGDFASFPADVPQLYEAVREAASALLIACTPH